MTGKTVGEGVALRDDIDIGILGIDLGPGGGVLACGAMKDDTGVAGRTISVCAAEVVTGTAMPSFRAATPGVGKGRDPRRVGGYRGGTPGSALSTPGDGSGLDDVLGGGLARCSGRGSQGNELVAMLGMVLQVGGGVSDISSACASDETDGTGKGRRRVGERETRSRVGEPRRIIASARSYTSRAGDEGVDGRAPSIGPDHWVGGGVDTFVSCRGSVDLGR